MGVKSRSSTLLYLYAVVRDCNAHTVAGKCDLIEWGENTPCNSNIHVYIFNIRFRECIRIWNSHGRLNYFGALKFPEGLHALLRLKRIVIMNKILHFQVFITHPHGSIPALQHNPIIRRMFTRKRVVNLTTTKVDEDHDVGPVRTKKKLHVTKLSMCVSMKSFHVIGGSS